MIAIILLLLSLLIGETYLLIIMWRNETRLVDEILHAENKISELKKLSKDGMSIAKMFYLCTGE